MKKNLLLAFAFSSTFAFAKDSNGPNAHPVRAWYGMSATEFIFSFGDVTTPGATAGNVMRFTPFINSQSQMHYNFSNHAGIYTGFGVRNVGFINTFSVAGEEKVKVKQRAYSFGIPLALKLGGMENGNYIAFGAEAEFMFHYKEKIYQGNRSAKTAVWFSSEVNQFNPSLFADIRFHNGTFFRFRYYLNDFLANKDMSFFLPQSGNVFAYKPQKSTLFYISIGSAFKVKKKHHATNKEV